MRSVLVHLRDANEEDVADFLRQEFPGQAGPPWIAREDGDPCLYVTVEPPYDPELFELGELEEVIAALGAPPTVTTVVHVARRHDGDAQVRQFLGAVLTRFQGVAHDDYTGHPWTLAEIESGALVEGHPFFDHRGWREEMRTEEE